MNRRSFISVLALFPITGTWLSKYILTSNNTFTCSMLFKAKHLDNPNVVGRCLQLLECDCAYKLGLPQDSEVPGLIQNLSIVAVKFYESFPTLAMHKRFESPVLTEYAKSLTGDRQIEFTAFLKNGKCIYVGCEVKD